MSPTEHLFHAAKHGYAAATRSALLDGANPNYVDDDGKTPHDLAIACGEQDAATLLQPDGKS
jgi:ankyrin repeat protein